MKFEIFHAEGYAFFRSERKRIGLCLRLMPFDLDSETDSSDLLIAMRNLSPKISIRMIRDVAYSFETVAENMARPRAFEQMGHKVSKTYLILEAPGSWLLRKKKISETSLILAVAEELGQVLDLKPLSALETLALLDVFRSEFLITERSLEAESGSLGVVRNLIASHGEVFEREFQNFLEDLEIPYRYVLHFRKIDEVRAKLLLEKKEREGRGGAHQQLESVSLELKRDALEASKKLFYYESQFCLTAVTKEKLQAKLMLLKQKSKYFQTQIETLGLFPSFMAMGPGMDPHVELIESDEMILEMAPIRDLTNKHQPLAQSLWLARKGNPYAFNLFDEKYQVYNSLIVGRSGSGKSVLLGLATKALLNDPNIQIIKVDVGGSHSKECELFGGTEYVLELGRASGINPFEIVIAKLQDSEKIAVLSKFLSVLIQEEKETSFTKELRSEIETSLQNYLDGLTPEREPSLQDFVQHTQDFPRMNLLKRWSEGVYAHTFGGLESATRTKSEAEAKLDSATCAKSGATAELDNTPSAKSGVAAELDNTPSAKSGAIAELDKIQQSKLIYYNFSKIFQASDPEFAQAGMAAVLAKFNTDTLTQKDKKIVLICDETPFFIKTCFEFFKFTTANVRKFGHAVILTAQRAKDFVQGEDYGIIQNSPQKFIFTKDINEKEFQEMLSLTDEELEAIETMRSDQFEREVLLKDQLGSRKLTIRVTPEEYWELTTSRVDKDKILKIMEQVPGISLRETIEIISRERSL